MKQLALLSRRSVRYRIILKIVEGHMTRRRARESLMTPKRDVALSYTRQCAGQA
jgi:hypothetical protein